MNLLKKIKLNYNLKLFQDYVSNQRFDEAYNLIQKLSKNDKIDLFLLLKNSQKILTNLPSDFYKKKIIWNISYDLLDLSYINNFLDFYLSKNLKSSFNIRGFSNSLNDCLSNLKKNVQESNIDFNDFLTQSNLYQNLLLFDLENDYLFLNSCASFFETSQKNYFIYPNITFCYFYFINRPEDLLLRYKNKYKSSDASYDELFNFSNQQYLSKEQESKTFKVFENRKNFNVNVKSWTDENVISSFKGKIISYNKLLESPQEILVEILYHLKQYGMLIDINIEDIKNFISSNKINENIEGELSNNDKKFLSKNLDQRYSLY